MTMDKLSELRTQLPMFSLPKRLSGGQRERREKRKDCQAVGLFFLFRFFYFFSLIGVNGGCFRFLVNGGWFIFLKETVAFVHQMLDSMWNWSSLPCNHSM